MPKSIHHHFVVSCFVSLGIYTCEKWQTCFFSAKWINNKTKKGRVTWRKAQAMTLALNDEVISIYDTLMLDNTLRFQENSMQPSIWDVCLNIHKIFRRFFFNLLKCAYSMCMYICHFISTFFFPVWIHVFFIIVLFSSCQFFPVHSDKNIHFSLQSGLLIHFNISTFHVFQIRRRRFYSIEMLVYLAYAFDR